MDCKIRCAAALAHMEGVLGLPFPNDAHHFALPTLERRLAAIEREIGGITSPPPSETFSWNGLVWRLWRARSYSGALNDIEPISESYIREMAGTLAPDVTVAHLMRAADSVAPVMPPLRCTRGGGKKKKKKQQQQQQEQQPGSGEAAADDECNDCMLAAVQKLAFVAGLFGIHPTFDVLSKNSGYAFAWCVTIEAEKRVRRLFDSAGSEEPLYSTTSAREEDRDAQDTFFYSASQNGAAREAPRARATSRRPYNVPRSNDRGAARASAQFHSPLSDLVHGDARYTNGEGPARPTAKVRSPMSIFFDELPPPANGEDADRVAAQGRSPPSLLRGDHFDGSGGDVHRRRNPTTDDDSRSNVGGAVHNDDNRKEAARPDYAARRNSYSGIGRGSPAHQPSHRERDRAETPDRYYPPRADLNRNRPQKASYNENHPLRGTTNCHSHLRAASSPTMDQASTPHQGNRPTFPSRLNTSHPVAHKESSALGAASNQNVNRASASVNRQSNPPQVQFTDNTKQAPPPLENSPQNADSYPTTKHASGRSRSNGGQNDPSNQTISQVGEFDFGISPVNVSDDSVGPEQVRHYNIPRHVANDHGRQRSDPDPISAPTSGIPPPENHNTAPRPPRPNPLRMHDTSRPEPPARGRKSKKSGCGTRLGFWRTEPAEKRRGRFGWASFEVALGQDMSSRWTVKDGSSRSTYDFSEGVSCPHQAVGAMKWWRTMSAALGVAETRRCSITPEPCCPMCHLDSACLEGWHRSPLANTTHDYYVANIEEGTTVRERSVGIKSPPPLETLSRNGCGGCGTIRESTAYSVLQLAVAGEISWLFLLSLDHGRGLCLRGRGIVVAKSRPHRKRPRWHHPLQVGWRHLFLLAIMSRMARSDTRREPANRPTWLSRLWFWRSKKAKASKRHCSSREIID
ncbi:hypothetical protein CCM_06780 [Cordyceps militaris CM01]|uniref:Uncharacterized protein n=1 Tax=Cordyceps militaris (strain CM01) TaxID=983644 RepID=G3JKY6_CORMM|nr:uncharacterized protein CCM_06780 [Cordyceps militaris CM01]EGX90360.1 hypothetical protein CCM_06780 [Cordyceps militaris CM01]